MVIAPTGQWNFLFLHDSFRPALGALNRDLYCIVEQDMYPCDFDTPLPIAIRTEQYFRSCGLGAGRPLATAG